VVALAVVGVAPAACGAARPTARLDLPQPGKAPQAVPVPTPTPTPALGARGPRAVGPLTGLPAASDTVRRPALSVKIDNAPPARPQVGLDRADLVTEVLVEGGLTRLLATFQSQQADAVGPIRSARPVDGALLRMLRGGLFAYSGAADGEIAPAQSYSTAALISHDADPSPFRLDPTRGAPQNVLASTAVLYAYARAHHADRPAPPRLFTRSRDARHAVPATRAELAFSPVSTAVWAWDPTARVWQRSQDGTPHLLIGGAQVHATDVVILRVAVGASGIFDAAHHEDPFVYAYGTAGGEALVLRDGRLETGRWERPTVADPLRLLDARGASLPLAPGTTWLELVPLGGTVTVR